MGQLDFLDFDEKPFARGLNLIPDGVIDELASSTDCFHDVLRPAL